MPYQYEGPEEVKGPVIVPASDYYDALTKATRAVLDMAQIRGMDEPPIYGIARASSLGDGLWDCQVWTSPEMADLLDEAMMEEEGA